MGSCLCIMVWSIKLQSHEMKRQSENKGRNVNKPKSMAARTVYGSIFLPFYVNTVCFFLSRWKQNRIKLCYNMLQFLEETNQHCKKHKAESQTTQIISFSSIVCQELPIKKLGDRHPNTIELASWLVHALCDFKAT